MILKHTGNLILQLRFPEPVSCFFWVCFLHLINKPFSMCKMYFVKRLFPYKKIVQEIMFQTICEMQKSHTTSNVHLQMTDLQINTKMLAVLTENFRKQCFVSYLNIKSGFLDSREQIHIMICSILSICSHWSRDSRCFVVFILV